MANEDIFLAAKTGNLDLFYEHIGLDGNLLNKKQMMSLLNLVDDFGNTIFHYLLAEQNTWFKNKKKRNAQIEICHYLLGEAIKIKQIRSLDALNNAGHTPLHLAIKSGYNLVVSAFVKAGADISIVTRENTSSLELATMHKHGDIYKLLLERQSEILKKGRKGFDAGQIKNAHAIFQKSLKTKQHILGVVGTFMAIACPVGAVLAFYQLPFLEILFASLIPGIGPFIGLAGAIALAGMLCWSMYNKATSKYGALAQEKHQLEAADLQIKSLEAKLNELDVKLTNVSTKQEKAKIQKQKELVIQELREKYRDLKDAFRDIGRDGQAGAGITHRAKNKALGKARNADWATEKDALRAKVLACGAFICSFSGIFGILGALSSYMPAVAVTTAIFASIPVVGWCALGVAVLVGVIAAVWVYKAKYKPALAECGKIRLAIHKQKEKLYEKCQEFEEQNNQKSVSSQVGGSSTKNEVDEVNKESKGNTPRHWRPLVQHSKYPFFSGNSSQVTQVVGQDPDAANLPGGYANS